jgi:hypothetical protein
VQNTILACMVVIAFILVLRLGYDKSLEWNKIARASLLSNPTLLAKTWHREPMEPWILFHLINKHHLPDVADGGEQL